MHCWAEAEPSTSRFAKVLGWTYGHPPPPDRDVHAGYDEHAVAVTGAEHEAAGVTAVMVSLQRGLESMGAVRTAAALAVPTIFEITNVLLMRGMIGKPGAGLCPVRGHSNVQGDRTMGIWEKMPEKFLAALDSRFGIVSPREHGVDTVDAIRAMRDGRANRSGVDQAEPQSRGPRRHCVDPAVAGPHRPRHPRRGETTGVGGRFDVDGSSVARQPAPAQRSGAQRGRHRLPAGAHPARPGHPVPWEQFSRRLRPHPRRDRRRRARLRRLQHARSGSPTASSCRTAPADSREFPTSTGKANFSVNPLEWVPVPEGRLVLQTLRSHDQYNTTIYGLDDRYRGVKGGRRVVFVNPADIERFGLSEGDRVDLVSEFTNGDGHMQERRAKDFMVVGYSTPVGNAAAYYPETNPLVPLDHTAARSNTPASKAIVIRLERT